MIEEDFDFIKDKDLMLKIFKQLVTAIYEISKLGIIHRDIKYDNIMLDFSNDDYWDPIVNGKQFHLIS